MRFRRFGLIAALAGLVGLWPSGATAVEPLRAWGTDGQAPGQLAAPDGVAVSPDGRIYALDAYNDRVTAFDARGSYLTEWGQPGSGDGELLFPRALAVAPDGDVFVADTENNRIQRFSPDGSLRHSFGAGLLDQPYGISISPSGSVVVADRKNDQIRVFSENGTLLRSFRGDGPAPLNLPRSVASTEDGIFVVDAAGLHDFTNTGELRWERLDNGYNAGLAADATDDVFAGRQGIGARIDEFSRQGAPISAFGSYGSGSSQFQSPYGIAVDCTASIYIADAETHRVIKWGDSPEQFPPCGSSTDGTVPAPGAPSGDATSPPGPATSMPPMSLTPPGSGPLRLYLRARRVQRPRRGVPLVVAAGCNRACQIHVTIRLRRRHRWLPVLRTRVSTIPAGTQVALHLRLFRHRRAGSGSLARISGEATGPGRTLAKASVSVRLHQ